MQKNSIFAAMFLLVLSACSSVLSQSTDEMAWKDYFKELKSHQKLEDRTLASATMTATPTTPPVVEVRSGVKILEQILDEMPFRNLLMSCDHRECYQNQLVISFDQAFRRVKGEGITLTAEEYTAEQKRFLDLYAYEKMQSWVDSFHQMLLSGVELRSAQRAVELAHTCESTLATDSEVQITAFSPYLGGITYIPHSYYSCLNDHWPSELDQLLKETSDRLGITIKTAEAKRWILQKQVAPIYRKTLNDFFSKRRQEESARWQETLGDPEKKLDFAQLPQLRKEYFFLNIESLLTQNKGQKNSQGVSR